MGQTQVGKDVELSARTPRTPRPSSVIPNESTLPSAVEPPLTPRPRPVRPPRPRPRPRPSTPGTPGGRTPSTPGGGGGGGGSSSETGGRRVGIIRRAVAGALRFGERKVRERRARRAAKGKG